MAGLLAFAFASCDCWFDLHELASGSFLAEVGRYTPSGMTTSCRLQPLATTDCFQILEIKICVSVFLEMLQISSIFEFSNFLLLGLTRFDQGLTFEHDEIFAWND